MNCINIEVKIKETKTFYQNDLPKFISEDNLCHKKLKKIKQNENKR